MKLAGGIFAVGLGSLLVLLLWAIVYGLINGNVVLGSTVEDIWSRWFALSLLFCLVGGLGVVFCEWRSRK